MGRVVLTERDFQTLISGGIVKSENGTQIALQDIGYFRMRELLDKQINNFLDARKSP